VADFRYRRKAQAKILFLLHALLKEIQECLSSHQSQEFSGINGLRLSTNDRFAPQAAVRSWEVDKKSCSRDQTTRFIARPEWRR
jgi:hypothetical protein